MNKLQEIQARLILAKFEAQQSREAAERRSRRWRVAFSLWWIVACMAGSVYLQMSNWQISGAQVCAFLLIGSAAAAWPTHQFHEKFQALKIEIERLKDELADQREVISRLSGQSKRPEGEG